MTVAAGGMETRPTELSKTRRRTRGSINLGKGNFGELKKEEDVVPALQRRTSMANLRKRSSWASITPRVLKASTKKATWSWECPDDDSFLQAAALFLRKWKASEEEGVASFIEYFESSWLDQNITWYEGYAIDHPSTNNALESTNMQTKRQNTIRERLELSRFLAVVEQDIVKNWSAERAPGRDGDEPKIPVQDVPKRDLKLWTEAYQWASSPRESLKAGNLIYVASSTLDNELATAIRDVEKKNQSASWADFDDFAACRHAIWKVTIDPDSDQFRCNCPGFLKGNICKHSLGCEIRLKVSEAPSQAKMIPIGQKRTRGRPKLAKAALVHLELAAKRKRLSIVSAMPAAPVINEEEQKKRKQEEKKALALKREKEEREAEQIKQLPEWEQFLLKRKPIIALDGYIPNSVVRAAIGFVKPKSPEPVWRLKPSVPNFQWCTSKEDVVDLSAAVKVKVITPPPKQAAVITAVPQKTTPIKRDTPEVQQPPAIKSTQKIAQKSVSIDLSANMDMRVASRPQPVRDLPQPKREKSLSICLPTAGTASGTLIEEPAEEEKQQFEAEYESQDEEQKPKTAGSQKRELSMERQQPHAQGKKSGLPKTPGKAPPLPRNLTEQELGLLQKIVKEDWFPQGVLPAFEPVMDVLLSFVDKGEIKVYTKVCDYIVAIAKEIGIPQRYLNRCGDRLTKQSAHTAALIRKKSLWTLRQLGINRKDLISAILPGLADAKDDIREEAIAALNDLMGEQGQQGLSDLMTSLGMNKPLNTKEERQAALKAISEKLTTGDKKGGKGAGWDTAKEKIQIWVGSLTAKDPTSSYEAKAAEVQKQSSRWDTFTPGASRGSRASMTFSELDSDMDEEEFVRTKSGHYHKPSRHKTSLSRKSTGKQESNVSERVEQGTETSPPHRKGDMIPTRRADEEYLFNRCERYGSEYFDAGGTDEDDENIYGSRAQFLPTDEDFTPTPRGASIQNVHAHQEQATTLGQQTDGRRRRYWPQDRSGKLADYDSDAHSVSQYETDQEGGTHRYETDREGGTHRYETDREGGTHRTADGTDIMSVADSGIVSDISSHVHPRDSLYKQGLPTLSPITSQSQLAGERPKKKAPEGRDLFETPAAQQRTQKKKGMGKEKEKESGKEGKVVFTSNNLPPITYINTEQPTTAGEAGLRCLHSIRVVDKERADSEKHKIESVPGRLTMHTQDQSAGETSYGLLQMTWTTNVPALPILPETRGEALVPKDIMQPWDAALPWLKQPGLWTQQNAGELGEALVPKDIMQPWDAALPWLKQPGLWTQQNAASLINELQKNLPGIKGDRGQDFQWKRPLPAAKVASRDPLAQRPDRHQCEHIRLAKKKMHHFTSGKNRQLLKDDTTTSMKTEPSQHLLSMIRQSSMSFLPPAPLQDVIRHIAANAEINA
ncbi:uncharacterized protein [Littorina saxatilis]|uniref:uncharacterized protein n=1 Tax=Littorina saxatilis TaxID=31220 RepID=UPI0038B5C9D7